MIRSILFLPVLLALMSSPLSAQWVVKHVDKHGATIHDLHILPDGTGFAVGEQGLILRTDDFGESWALVPGNIEEDLFQIALLGVDTLVVRGENSEYDGTLHRSVDGGLTWEMVYSMEDNQLYSLQFFNDSFGLASGSDVIIRTVDGGMTWSTVLDIPAMTNFKVGLIWMDVASDSVAYAGVLARQNGFENLTRYLLKSVDMGVSWEEINVLGNDFGYPELFFYDESLGFTDWMIPQRTQDGGITWDTTNNIGYVVDMSMPSPTIVYTVNHPNAYIALPDILTEFAICSSTDGGMTWEGEMTYGAHLETIQFLNDSVGFVAGDHSLIMKTEHGGGEIVGDYPWDLYTSTTDVFGASDPMVIYPNPAQATVTLEWQEHGPPAKHQARIYDVTGQLVLDQTLRTPRSVLSFQSFPPGTYFLQHVVDGKVVEVRPVIVQP